VEHQELKVKLINQLGPINTNSPKQLKEALFKVGVIVDGTSRETLNQRTELPVISDILKYRKIDKLKPTYGEKLISSLHPITGRLHSDYFQLGTNTGRMSCREPNIQSIVNGELRNCFRPESGYKLIVVDYSQIELRVLAGMAQDFKMIEALNQGIDLHKLTASIVTQKAMDEVSKDEREIAKTLNFGLVYGAGVDNLAKHLQQKGLMVNRSEMEEFKQRFLKRFIGVALYIRRATKGRKYEIRTLSGRRKEFPPDKFGHRKSASYTEKLNTPIQGSAADIAKLGLYKVYQVLKGTKGKLVAFIHDEIVVEIPTEQAEELLPQIEQALKEAGQYYLPNVEIGLSANICDSWMEKSA
ncbi:MAG: DNA polymerase, partial [Candidatus Poribacteria bacterium]|nr:DNA polymerase [Candidatus Poribacteria bacterium]